MPKYRLVYEFQCVPFFMSNDGYAAIAAIDKLFKSLGIVHCMLPH
ncbi:unnamed protein product, partial [marine sediment metagenome]